MVQIIVERKCMPDKAIIIKAKKINGNRNKTEHPNPLRYENNKYEISCPICGDTYIFPGKDGYTFPCYNHGYSNVIFRVSRMKKWVDDGFLKIEK
jgi:hypothetical protein